MFHLQSAHFHQKFFIKVCSLFVLTAFTIQSIFPSQVSAQSISQLNLPQPGSMISVTNAFDPLMLRGLTIDPKNPLQMDFIVNTGDTTLAGKDLEQESLQLVRYFLAALTTPESQLWVNLSPYEKDRIIPQTLGETEMGRDMLAQDYVLKQLTSSLMYPESELGKKFWDKVYGTIYEKVSAVSGQEPGNADSLSLIPDVLNTFNKVWILPRKAKVYQHGSSAFVVESELKVMLEEDFVAMQKSKELSSPNVSIGDPSSKQNGFPTKAFGNDNLIEGSSQETLAMTQMKDIIREIIVPAIEEEVNHGEHFAKLRQIFNALILATWYKKNLKSTLLSQIYVDQGKVEGIRYQQSGIRDQQSGVRDDKNNELNPDSRPLTTVQRIYDEYLQAFKTGAYDMIREDYDPAQNAVVTRKYFSGGENLAMLTTNVYEETIAFVGLNAQNFVGNENLKLHIGFTDKPMSPPVVMAKMENPLLILFAILLTGGYILRLHIDAIREKNKQDNAMLGMTLLYVAALIFAVRYVFSVFKSQSSLNEEGRKNNRKAENNNRAMLNFQDVAEIPRHFTQGLRQRGLNVERIEAVQLVGDSTIEALFKTSEAVGVLSTSIQQAVASILFAGTGKDGKEVADGNAVYFADLNLRSYVQDHPSEAIVIMADEGSRDHSFSLKMMRIYHAGYANVGVKDFNTVEELEAEVSQLKLSGARVHYYAGDALENTNGLAIEEAKTQATDAWSLAALFDGNVEGIRNPVYDDFRIAGFSYNAPEAADIQPLDLPSVALPKIAKARGVKIDDPNALADFMNQVNFVVLGKRGKDFQKEAVQSSDTRHWKIIENVQGLQKIYPGLQLKTPGDGDFAPRAISLLGVEWDNRITIVGGRSGAAESTIATLIAKVVENGQFTRRFVSTKSTAPLLNVENANHYTDEELEYFTQFGYITQGESPDHERTLNANDLPGSGVFSMTAVTGASEWLFGKTLNKNLQRVTFNDAENTAQTNSIVVTADGSVFMVRTTFKSEDLARAKHDIQIASPAAATYMQMKNGNGNNAMLVGRINRVAAFAVAGTLNRNAFIRFSKRDDADVLWEHLVGKNSILILEGDGYIVEKKFRFPKLKTNIYDLEEGLSDDQKEYLKSLLGRIAGIYSYKITIDQQLNPVARGLGIRLEELSINEQGGFDLQTYLQSVIAEITRKIFSASVDTQISLQDQYVRPLRRFLLSAGVNLKQWGKEFYKNLLHDLKFISGDNDFRYLARDLNLGVNDILTGRDLHEEILEKIISLPEHQYFSAVNRYIHLVDDYAQSLDIQYANDKDMRAFFKQIRKKGYYADHIVTPFPAEALTGVLFLKIFRKGKWNRILNEVSQDSYIINNFETISEEKLETLFSLKFEALTRGMSFDSSIEYVIREEVYHHFLKGLLANPEMKLSARDVHFHFTDARDYHQSSHKTGFRKDSILEMMQNILDSGVDIYSMETAGGATTQSAILTDRHGAEPFDPFRAIMEQTRLLRSNLEKAVGNRIKEDSPDWQRLFDRYELKEDRVILEESEVRDILARYDFDEKGVAEVLRIYRIRQEMLFRGPFIVGMNQYPDVVVEEAVKLFYKFGVDTFRIFIADNDYREINRVIGYVKDLGEKRAKVQPAIHYTNDFATGDKGFVELAKEMVREAGSYLDSLVIKDAPGILTPQAIESLIKALRADPETENISIQVHTHASGGKAARVYVAAIRANGSQAPIIVDVSVGREPYGQPSVHAMKQLLGESKWGARLNISEEGIKVAEKRVRKVIKDYPQVQGVSLEALIAMADPEVGLPGGMFSYFFAGDMTAAVTGLATILAQQFGLKLLDGEGRWTSEGTMFLQAFFLYFLEEQRRVVKDWGRLSRVTPYSNWIGKQAIVNRSFALSKGYVILNRGADGLIQLSDLENLPEGIGRFNLDSSVGIEMVMKNILFIWAQDPFQQKYYPDMNLDLFKEVLKRHVGTAFRDNSHFDWNLYAEILDAPKMNSELSNKFRKFLAPFFPIAEVMEAREIDDLPIVDLKVVRFQQEFLSQDQIFVDKEYVRAAAVRERIIKFGLHTDNPFYLFELNAQEFADSQAFWREQYHGMDSESETDPLLFFMYGGAAKDFSDLRLFWDFIADPQNNALTETERGRVIKIWNKLGLKRTTVRAIAEFEGAPQDLIENPPQLDEVDLRRVDQIREQMRSVKTNPAMMAGGGPIIKTGQPPKVIVKTGKSRKMENVDVDRGSMNEDRTVNPFNPNNTGGIDLNPAMFDSFEVQKDDAGMLTEINGTPISEIRSNIQGLHPFIIKITPMADAAMFQLLGLNDQGQEPLADHADQKPVYADQKFLASKES